MSLQTRWNLALRDDWDKQMTSVLSLLKHSTCLWLEVDSQINQVFRSENSFRTRQTVKACLHMSPLQIADGISNKTIWNVNCEFDLLAFRWNASLLLLWWTAKYLSSCHSLYARAATSGDVFLSDSNVPQSGLTKPTNQNTMIDRWQVELLSKHWEKG